MAPGSGFAGAVLLDVCVCVCVCGGGGLVSHHLVPPPPPPPPGLGWFWFWTDAVIVWLGTKLPFFWGGGAFYDAPPPPPPQTPHVVMCRFYICLGDAGLLGGGSSSVPSRRLWRCVCMDEVSGGVKEVGPFFSFLLFGSCTWWPVKPNGDVLMSMWRGVHAWRARGL